MAAGLHSPELRRVDAILTALQQHLIALIGAESVKSAWPYVEMTMWTCTESIAHASCPHCAQPLHP